MKKVVLGLLSLSVALFFTGCKDNEGPEEAKYPTEGLTVAKQQNVLVLEATGAWCQYCPNGAEELKIADATYGDRIVPLAAHTGSDALEGTASLALLPNYMSPNDGVPSLFANNEKVSGSLSDAIAGLLYPDPLPVFGVNHTVVETDSSYNIYPLLEVLTSSSNEDYLVQAYMVLDGVIAKDYGVHDLNQVSSVPLVTTGSGAVPSTWAQDAAIVNGEPQVKAGEVYYHEHAVWSMDERFSDWGIGIATFNPFGRDFIEGDLIGTKYTPILLSIEKEDLTPWETGISFATIVWRLRTDGTGGYDYVNGYMSHFSNNK